MKVLGVNFFLKHSVVIMGGQHDVLFLSGSPPILYIYIHMYIFLMANKLCCSAVTYIFGYWC